MIRFFVPGDPAPQGSKTAYVRGGRAVLVEASKRLPPWRKQIETVAAQEYDGEPIDQPVKVTVDFFVHKPKNPRFSRPATGDDLDKLQRAIGDGLEKGGVLKNDSRIVSWVTNQYYADSPESMGAVIQISAIEE